MSAAAALVPVMRQIWREAHKIRAAHDAGTNHSDSMAHENDRCHFKCGNKKLAEEERRRQQGRAATMSVCHMRGSVG